jgi:immune inhibitor A
MAGRLVPSFVSGSLALLLAGAIAGPTPTVSADGGGSTGKTGAARGHSKPLPAFVVKRERERRMAADLVAKGQAAPDENGVVTLRNGRFVDYRLEGTEYLTAVLIDFADLRHGGIPPPDRTVDNSSYWPADVSPQHYYDMLFAPGGGSYGLPSMRDYYLEQSSGRFTWTGQV